MKVLLILGQFQFTKLYVFNVGMVKDKLVFGRKISWTYRSYLKPIIYKSRGRPRKTSTRIAWIRNVYLRDKSLEFYRHNNQFRLNTTTELTFLVSQ
jgi:hypothetical protein